MQESNSTSKSLLTRVLRGDIIGATDVLPGVKNVKSGIGKVIEKTHIKDITHSLPLKNERRSSLKASQLCSEDTENKHIHDARVASPVARVGGAAKAVTKFSIAATQKAPEIFVQGARNSKKTVSKAPEIIARTAVAGAGGAVTLITETPTLLKTSATTVANSALTIATGVVNDGDTYNGGFVTFKTLTAVHAARQMVHISRPFSVQVLEAPDPRDGT